MGSCLGRCLPCSDNNSHEIWSCQMFRNTTDNIDFNILMDGNPRERRSTKRNCFSGLFAKRADRRNSKKPVLELVDEILNPQITSYSRLKESRLPSTGSCTSRDIPLQCLDARALLAHTTSSTPASSLDLEWEHETLPISMIHDASGSSWSAIPKDFTTCILNERPPQTAVITQDSDSEWSRVSSANSLEWDNVQNSLHPSPPASDIDTDTQMLLCEIERLTSQTLSETGLDLQR